MAVGRFEKRKLTTQQTKMVFLTTMETCCKSTGHLLECICNPSDCDFNRQNQAHECEWCRLNQKSGRKYIFQEYTFYGLHCTQGINKYFRKKFLALIALPSAQLMDIQNEKETHQIPSTMYVSSPVFVNFLEYNQHLKKGNKKKREKMHKLEGMCVC